MTDLVCLAKIVAAHGIKGEVKIKSFTRAPKDVCTYGKLSNKDETRFFDLTFLSFAKELLRVKIKGVDTRNDAESLVGTELYLSRSRLPDLAEDTFYQTDLVGLEVFDEKTGQKIGKVMGVFNFGAGDILEIKFDEKKQTEMLPFNDTYVPVVDTQSGFIKVREMSYQEDEENDA